MMVTASLIVGLLSASFGHAVLVPERLPYAELMDGGDSLLDKFHTGGGVSIVSITGIPGFARAKQDAVEEFLRHSDAGVSHTLPDGSIRRTVARQGEIGEEQRDAPLFDAIVSQVTLAAVRQIHNDLPSMVGPYLDHFHAYTKSEGSRSDELALDWHVDQGVLLVFSPGANVDGDISGEFFVRDANGDVEQVQFESGLDDLVLLVGDGMTQVLGSRDALPAVPHALRLASTDQKQPRIWFGRMVLPAANAVHNESGKTFGEIRDALVGGTSSETSSLGCSGSLPQQVPRLLNEDVKNCTDEPNTSYCWHACMSHEEFGVTPEDCEAQNLVLGCANADGFLWTGRHDNQFAIRCIDPETAVNYTYPVEDDADDHGDHDHDKSSGVSYGLGIISTISAVFLFAAAM